MSDNLQVEVVGAVEGEAVAGAFGEGEFCQGFDGQEQYVAHFEGGKSAHLIYKSVHNRGGGREGKFNVVASHCEGRFKGGGCNPVAVDKRGVHAGEQTLGQVGRRERDVERRRRERRSNGRRISR